MLNESNISLEEDGIEEEILVDEEVAITKAMWGDIGGNIENQTDLQNALDAKQDNLTESQLNAVNSGITAGKVANYDGYANQIASKADQSALDAEATTRGEADTALGTRIDNEVLARQQADNGLQTQIDAITSKSDVVDVVANYAALQAYDTSSLGNNDVIKVLDDETHQDALTYYRWSTTTQTWTYIGQEAPYYSKGQMDVMLQGKQDTLTAGANIQIQNGTISATDTTYTAGNGLNLNGTEFSADTTVLATKEDLEDYYTKTETDSLLAPKLEAEVVAELPETGTEGKLYLTPKNYTRSTATGNPITASVTDGAGTLESFQLDGDTFQQTYTGKNIFATGDFDYTNGGIRSIGSNGVINTSGTLSQTWGFNIYGGHNLIPSGIIPAGTYTVSITKAVAFPFILGLVAEDDTTTLGNFTIPAGSTSYTFTIDQPAKYFTLWSNYANHSGEQISVTDLSIMIESGSSATSFEPFVGGTPSPNPDYPQPIQTVTGEQTVTVLGKNLFNKDNYHILACWINNNGVLQNGNNWTYWIPCEPNTTYTIQKMVQQPTSKNRFQIATSSVLPAIGVQTSGRWSVTDGDTTTAHTYMTSADAKYLIFNVGNYDSNPATTTTGAQMRASVQVEKGSTATTYAPYQATSYPINLGKNLFDNTGWEQGQYSDGTWASGNTKRATSGFIPIEGGTYTMSLNSTDSRTAFINLNYFDSAKTWLGNRATLGLELFSDTDRAKTFTLPNNASYLRVTVRPYGGDTEGDDIVQYAPSEKLQVEAGSTATTYAPYFTPIELCKLDTYQDYIYKDGDSWKVHKATAMQTIVSENVGVWSSYTNIEYATYSKSEDYDGYNTWDGKDVLCGHATFARGSGLTWLNNASRAGNIIVNASVSNYWIGFVKGTPLETMKSKLNGAKILYPLATPTDTVITDQTLIAQLEAIRTASLETGANTITNTAAGSNLAGDMEIGYYGYNPTNRYDKFIWLDLNNNYEQIGE